MAVDWLPMPSDAIFDLAGMTRQQALNALARESRPPDAVFDIAGISREQALGQPSDAVFNIAGLTREGALSGQPSDEIFDIAGLSREDAASAPLPNLPRAVTTGVVRQMINTILNTPAGWNNPTAAIDMALAAQAAPPAARASLPPRGAINAAIKGLTDMPPSFGTTPLADAYAQQAAAQPVAELPPAENGGSQMTEIERYIRMAARQRGIDPDIAVRVAKSEGGVSDPVRQSDFVRNGVREPSYGPFQLYMGGGLGNAALKAGIDPRDPNQWQQGVDFALDNAKKSGWGAWYGAAKAGIGNRDGLGGVPALPPPREIQDHPIAPMDVGGAFGSIAPNSQQGGWANIRMDADAGAGIGSMLTKDEKQRRGKGFIDSLSFDNLLMPAARVSGGMGDANQTGNALLSALNGPTMADVLLAKRLGRRG